MRKILVIANETVESGELHEVVRRAAWGQRSRVLVVAPALSADSHGRLRHRLSDEDGARAAARGRLARALASLAARGVDANGIVGGGDPLQATLDALHLFPADEVVIATHPEHRSNWLARGLVDRVAAHYDGPIVHLVVEAGPELALAA